MELVMSSVSIEDRFHFDLSGFLLLRGVLSEAECKGMREVLAQLEGQEYEDVWMKEKGPGRPTKESNREGQVRLNGVVRLDPVFDQLIAHSTLVPFLREFVGEPQLINTWSISKFKGAKEGGWHRGIQPTDFSCRNGDIRSRMLNVVFLLTDNGPEDGCVVAIPGSHKNNIDLNWGNYKGLEMPGAMPVTGKTGDVFLFSEAVIHNGLLKTTDGARTNLYYNYVHAHYNVMMREPKNSHHFYFPPGLRERFNDEQKAMTAWMELVKWEY
jgi:hypothetical protein